MSKLNGIVSSESPLVLSLYFDRIEFTITFLAQDGSPLTTDGTTVAEITAKYGQPVYPVRVVLPGNAILDYWHKSGENTRYTFTTMPAENLKLYAEYDHVYTLSYNADGGEGSLPFSVLYSPDTKVTLFGPGYPEDNTYALTKEGYTFSGWMYNGTVYQPKDTFVMLEEDVTLVAEWTANKYTITFNSNGGSDVTSITEDCGKAITKPEDPTKTGYTFAGWFKDNSLQNEWDFSTDKVPINGTTLYAKWQPNKYTLTINYIYEDGSKAAESYSESLDYDSSYEITPPEISGYLPDRSTVSGIINGNISITVTYGAYAASAGGKNYWTLEDALNNAKEGDKVILLKDYTLTQSVTVPKGVFLVLPCADDDVGYDLTADYEKVHNPDGTSTSTKDLSVLYRTLTIPSNVTLNVEGQLLVNAVTGRPAAGHYDMDVTGGYAQILLEGNIVVKDGAILEVCGYVKGNGQVSAESGAEIREMYVVINWRGGSQAYRIFPSVFPFNEYDCHSIQSTLYLESGALLSGNVKMYAQNKLTSSGPPQYFYIRFPQIGSNGLIQLDSDAHLVRSYDAEAVNGSSSDLGRTYFELFGGGKFSHSSLKIIGISMSTKNFTYPLDGDISIGLHDGNYVSEDNFKILTGAQVTIYDNASLTIVEGKHIAFYDEFIDPDNVDNTEYPDRPAALLILHDNAVLNVNGSFAGIIERSGSGTGTVNIDKNASTTVPIKESNGIDNDQTVRELTFKTKYQYTIFFDSKGGSDQPPMKYITGDKIELPVPERLGHDFNGWYSDSALTQLCNPNSITSGNMTLYAGWIESIYVISFETKDGTSIKSQDLKYGDKVSKPEDPSRLGYDFAGWYSDSKCTIPYDFDTPVKESFTLYAEWDLLTYNITYILDGGNNHSSNPSTYNVENPQSFFTPNKAGNTFQGWYTSLDPLGDKIIDTSGKAEDLTLYAKWEINSYTVTINYKCDEIDSKSLQKQYQSSLNGDELAESRTGYTLSGWYRDADCTNPWNFETDIVINDVTIYAKWTPVKYTITYKLDGGTNNDDNPKTYTVESSITLKDPIKTGYEFKGWFTDAGFTEGAEISSIVKGTTGDITLYANWKAIDYVIKFVNWDGSEISSDTYHYGDVVTVPENPQREADGKYTYSFKSWTPEVSNVTSDATYKAEYSETPVQYTITYESNGGTNNENNPASYNCESASITLCNPTETGHTFKGWFTDAGFTEGNVKTVIETGTTGNITLYAKWQINTFTVTVPASTSGDYTIKYEGSNVVNYGSDFEFTVELSEAYSGSSITVKANGTSLTKSDDGSYIIKNITETQTIAVEGITKNSYTVTIPTGDGYTITPATTTVNYDDSFTFTFTLDEAYSKSSYIIKVNGSSVSLNKNQYIIENVRSDINISVEGVEKNTYTVTFDYDNGSAALTQRITHGDKVTKPNDPTKAGHTFTGWQSNGTVYDFNSEVVTDITLTAVWTKNNYTVVFDGNDATSGSMSNQPFVYDADEQALTKNTFIKTGYSFAGWSKDVNASEATYEDCQSVSNLTSAAGGTVTLYAVWKANTYSVSYDSNGGSGDIGTGTATYNSEFTLNDGKSFTRLGYNLTAWNTEADGSGIQYNLNQNFEHWNLTDNLTLYAQWTPLKYTITYNLDGGTNAAGNPATYTIETETITLKDPTKTGHTFKGWYKYADFSNKVESIAKGSTGNITLHAKWETDEYSISFNTNGGTPALTQIKYTVNDNSITLPTSITKNGYEFDMWCTDENLENEFVYIQGTTTGNITLYAKWTAVEYLITYELDGGNAADNPGKYTIETETITLKNPTKTGYTFAGWSSTDLSGTSLNVVITKGSTENRTYTANWTANTYTVVFDGNHATSGSMSNQPFIYDAEKQALTENTFTKTGYSFAGWSENKSASEVTYTDGQSVRNLTSAAGGTVTLYAVWNINHYTVTLPSNSIPDVPYTTAVADGYDNTSVKHGSKFEFTVTFTSDIGNNTPVISLGSETVSASSHDGLTYTFTINEVTSNLELSLTLVSNLTAALEDLVTNSSSATNYKLSLSGTTLTVSIINPKADASGLISKISNAVGNQSIPANSSSGRTDAGSTFLAYLPDDDTLWKNNLAEYAVEIGGCKIVFKQDEDAVEEAKIRYLTEIAQAVRVFRGNENWILNSFYGEIISTSAGIEDNDYKYIELAVLMSNASGLADETNPTGSIDIFTSLLTNFATVLALVGHEDAEFGYYSVDPNNLEQFDRIKIGGLSSSSEIVGSAGPLLNAATSLLTQMNMGVDSLNNPISNCFDENYNGLNGYAEQLCISKENGVRYTDVYHFKFTNHFHPETMPPVLHTITFNEVADIVSFSNFETDNKMIDLTFDFIGGYMGVGDILGEPSCVYGQEYSQLVAGELVVINIDPSSEYSISDLSVTTSSGQPVTSWYNDHSFIMPEGDVTITINQ
ncbi:InlB B-repeat-containing protein [Candidatus Methanomassiliicoccus intestinalis]|uniref:InlB B-repeat-containing protein n=1 Tax=Candidatus Methanomassiliicoccus intestinalis TaxID=1406512 RepID=UPI0037DD6D37